MEGMRVPGMAFPSRKKGQKDKREGARYAAEEGRQGLTSQGLESTLAAAAPEGGGRRVGSWPPEAHGGWGSLTVSRVVKEHVCVIHVHVGDATPRVSHRVPWRGRLSPDSLVTRTLVTLDGGPPGEPVVTPSSAEAPLPTVTEVTVTAGYNSRVSQRDTVEPTTPTGDAFAPC